MNTDINCIFFSHQEAETLMKLAVPVKQIWRHLNGAEKGLTLKDLYNIKQHLHKDEGEKQYISAVDKRSPSRQMQPITRLGDPT